MTRTRRLIGAALVVAAVGAAVNMPAAVHGGEPHEHGTTAQGADVAAARAATARYHRIAVAEADGYGVLADASGATCIEDPAGAGAMGTHLVKGSLVGDGEVDVERPEALLYDMTGSKPRLLGVEYVVFVADWGADREPPELFGAPFHLVPAGNRYDLPPFYALHVWLWHDNPQGDLHDWNPLVSC